MFLFIKIDILIFSYLLSPNIRHTTLASLAPKFFAHTVPQSPKNLTSTLPALQSPDDNRMPKKTFVIKSKKVDKSMGQQQHIYDKSIYMYNKASW